MEELALMLDSAEQGLGPVAPERGPLSCLLVFGYVGLESCSKP